MNLNRNIMEIYFSLYYLDFELVPQKTSQEYQKSKNKNGNVDLMPICIRPMLTDPIILCVKLQSCVNICGQWYIQQSMRWIDVNRIKVKYIVFWFVRFRFHKQTGEGYYWWFAFDFRQKYKTILRQYETIDLLINFREPAYVAFNPELAGQCFINANHVSFK